MKQIDKLKMMALMAMGILSFTITSCSSDEFYGFDEDEVSVGLEVIASSSEYTNYLLSQVHFYEFLKNIKTYQMEFVDIMDSITINRYDLTDEMNKLEQVKKDLFIKYPQYKSLNQVERSELMHIAIQKSSILCATDLNAFPRTKSSDSESQASLSLTRTTMGASWTVSVVSSYNDAIDACITYGMNNNKESGGYAFSDYSGLYINDSNATSSTMNFPVWDWRPYTPIFSFHYHPGGSTAMSDDDWSALAAMRTYGCDNMLIVTDDRTYMYQLYY